jgi:hypothetical protein
MNIPIALLRIINGEDGIDLECLTLLAAAHKGLATQKIYDHECIASAAFWSISSAFEHLYGGDLFSLGRPSFADHRLLAEILSESSTSFVSCEALTSPSKSWERALRFAVSDELCSFIDRVAGTALPMGDVRVFAAVGATDFRPEIGDPGEIRALLLIRGPAYFSFATARGMRRVKCKPGTVIVYNASAVMLASVRPERENDVLFLECGFQSAKLPARVPPFISTPRSIADKMLDMAEVTRLDCVIDLGCGDGVLIRAAADRGARAIGVERDKTISQRDLPLGSLVELRFEDAFDTSLANVSVVTMFLNSELNELLKSKLERELPSGARIVTHLWPIKGWSPDAALMIRAKESNTIHRLFAYRLKVEAKSGQESTLAGTFS